MKYLSWIFLFLLLPFLSFSQEQIIKGRVIDGNTLEALPYASVYFNATTNGTTTNDIGEFEISFSQNAHELVVSFLGYEPIVLPVEQKQINRPFLFKLFPRTEDLDVVNLSAPKSKKWYKHYQMFLDEFIGQSKFAKKTKILNPEVLQIQYDPITHLIKVKANEVLKIENIALGYQIDYLLEEFLFDIPQNKVSYIGYPKFTEAKSSKKFAKNRSRAFKGSSMHFMQSLLQGNYEQEGFVINKMYRASKTENVQKFEVRQVNILSLDHEARIVSEFNNSKAKDLSRVVYVDENEYHPKSELKGNTLSFNHHWQVTYTEEREEIGYLKSLNLYELPEPGPQISIMSMLAESIEIHPSGIISPPLGIIFKGYWSWEKVGDLLPSDYKPTLK